MDTLTFHNDAPLEPDAVSPDTVLVSPLSHVQATVAMAHASSIPIIASGGAGSREHFVDVFEQGKADAALAASIFHYNEIPIPDLKQYLRKNNITIR